MDGTDEKCKSSSEKRQKWGLYNQGRPQGKRQHFRLNLGVLGLMRQARVNQEGRGQGTTFERNDIA